MKLDPFLSKAARLAKRKKYDEAIKILKAEEDRYNGSYKYYYLLGVICLYAGIPEEALSNLKIARQIKINDPYIMLGFAVLHLKRLNTGQAVDIYLDVQEIEPDNKIVKNALSVIRKHSSAEALSDWITPERLSKLFPPIPGPGLSRQTITIGSFFLCAAFIVFLGLFISNKTPSKTKNKRPTAELILTGTEKSEPFQTGDIFRYTLTLTEVTNLYDGALSLFTNYRDEAAKINLNRILESNASEAIKSKSRLLMSYMEVPGFDSFNRNDNPSFEDVNKEPAAYRNVHVIWRGMATNVEITDEYTRFDFLVGYDTRITLEGITHVVFYSPVSINTERPLEVLGKIIVAPSYTEIALEGVAIHQSGRLEN